MGEQIEFAPKPGEGQSWDVAIIGSGPAALTAAIYTTRGAASTLLVGGENWGGQLMLTTKVDNFPGFPEGIEGPELMAKMRKQAERFGTLFVQKNVLSVDFESKPFKIVTHDSTFLAKTVIIATGADTKWLRVPGEDKLIGRGVSSCAPCDAPFFKNKRVAVVGGGDSAMEEAMVLTKYAEKVIVIHRRNELKASAVMQKRAFENGKIGFLWDTEVTEMVGNNKLEKLRLKTKLDSEQAKTLADSGKLTEYRGKKLDEKDGFLNWEMGVDGVFVAIGHLPATEIFKGKVETDEKGYVVKKSMENVSEGKETHNYDATTNISGVFVAGDVHDHGYRQAITAAGFGCMAGMDVLKYLDKDTPSW